MTSHPNHLASLAIRTLGLALLALTLSACGGGSSSSGGSIIGGSVASIVVTPSSTSAEVGDTVQFSAQALDANGTTLTVSNFTWVTSDSSIAIISNSGLVTAVGTGTVSITASAGGVTSAAAKLIVTTGSTTDVSNAMAVSGSNLNQPVAVAVDGGGNVWVANFNGSGITEILPATAKTDCSSGCVAFDSGSTGVIGNANYSDIAVDASNNVWIPAGSTLYQISGGVSSKLVLASSSVGGNYLAVDGSGNLWLSSAPVSTGTVSTVTNTGTLLSPSPGYAASSQYGGTQFDGRLAIDASGNVWVTVTSGNNKGNVVELPAGSPSTPVVFSGGGLVSPNAIAVDNSGNVWVVNANSVYGTGTSSVTEIKAGAASDCSKGCRNFTATGLNEAESGIAVDGDNNVWVAGGVGATVVEIEPGAAADCSTGCTTYTSSLLSHPVALAIDGNGNVWIADEDSNSIVLFPALAANTVTPIVNQPR